MNNDFQHPGFLHNFLNIAATLPETVAIHHLEDDIRLTYAELRTYAEGISGALGDMGVEAGMRVLLFLPNGIAFVATYLALIGRGAIPVLVNHKLTQREFSVLTKDSSPMFVVTNAKLLSNCANILANLPGLNAVVTIDQSNELTKYPFTARSLASINANPCPLQTPSDDQIITIQYTYKGLGQPLAVAHRYQSFAISINGLHERFHPQGPGSVHLVALPLYAVFGLTVLMVLPLSLGATMLISNTLPLHSIVDVLAEHKVSLVCLVPDLVRVFISQLEKRAEPIPQLNPRLMVLSGGSYLSPDMAANLSTKLGNSPVLQGYGLTESMPVMVQSFIGPTKPGSIGQMIAGIDMRIIDDRGDDVGVGQTGELIVSGPTICGEYWGNQQASARFFRNGWLHTGDLVSQDADGHIFFVGRRLRITKITAQMVDLTELELVAASHPEVQRARARVVRDDKGRNSLDLNVDCSTGQSGETILSYLKTHLSAWKLPRKVHMITPFKDAA